MLTGKSILHVKQGEGSCYSRTELRGYYNDLTEKVTKDDPKILVPKYAVYGEEKIYFPIGIFQYGLAAYDLFLKTGEQRYLEKTLACANWAVENQEPSGAWLAFADRKQTPYSSMAQGEGSSLLLRAEKATGDETYRAAAEKAIAFMLLPLEKGGTAVYEGDKVFLYECTNEPIVLNGWIFSYWGLRDYVLASKDSAMQALASKAEKTLAASIADFDTGYWSRYDLKERIASPFYHKLHIAQLRVMYDLTGDVTFEKYSAKWQGYLRNPLYKGAAFLKKAFQKVFKE